jgi:nucleoside-diphosphate-sugar epimerase
VLQIVEELIGRRLDVAYAPGRPFDVGVNVLDIARAGRYLGWRPRTGIVDGIARTLAWMRGRPQPVPVRVPVG